MVKKFAQLPVVMMAYHVPESANADYYPLQVLRTILFSGESSRMYQRLVDKNPLAISVTGSYGFALDPTLFEITVQPKEGVVTQTVENAVYEELDRLKNGAVSAEELEKAKNILLVRFYQNQKTIAGKADTLGRYEIFLGDYRKMFTAADEYGKVTAADIQRVARKYFTDKNRTVATLVPEKDQ